MIPTQDDVASLSRMARVALAARCARRVLPMFTSWDLVNPAEITMARQAIAQAEAVASRWPVVPREIAAHDSRLAQRALVLGLEAKHRIRDASDRSPVLAIWSATHSALAALDAIEGGEEAAVYSAYCAIYFAWVALETPRVRDAVGCTLGKKAMADDFEFARLEFPAGGPGHDRPISPNGFGELWPVKAPAWASTEGLVGRRNLPLRSSLGGRDGLTGSEFTSRRVRSYLPRASRGEVSSETSIAASCGRFELSGNLPALCP